MFVPLSILLQKSSGVVAVAVSVLLAYQLALLTWNLIPGEESKYQWLPPKVKTTQNSNKTDTKKLQQQHLFGEKIKVVKVEKKEAVSDAPKTKLNLTLVGVVAASDPASSSAIITYKNQQDSYFIDSKIEGTGATVSEIYEDRVILEVDDGFQTLMLDGVETLDKQRDSHESQGRAKSAEKQSANEVKRINLDRQALLKNPAKLTDYIRISPVREGNQLKGYRVRPGKDRSLFEQAGLKDNDLAIELNGIDLTDMQQAFSLMKAFPTMTDMSLTVERNGQLHELYFSIP